MKIYLYRNNSENNVINKDLDTVIELDGTLREQVSIMNPRITIQYVDEETPGGESLVSPTDFNYFYIPQFQRFYFVTDVVVINDKLLEIGGHVDVLESFKVDILNKEAIIARSSDPRAYNKKINDGAAVLYQNPNQVIKRGSNLKSFSYSWGNSGTGYVLAVAGGTTVIPPT